MSAAQRLEESDGFEALVADAFAASRQGAVIIAESHSVPAPRYRWLARHLEQLVPGGLVHVAGGGYFVIFLQHAGPAETWLVVERMRRGLLKSGWDDTVLGSANWPGQGELPMDVVATAFAALTDERDRLDSTRWPR